MGIQVVPEWMAELEEEDVAFLKNFLLCSGSLKEIAGLYGVTYPTVRLRLDTKSSKRCAWGRNTPATPMWR